MALLGGFALWQLAVINTSAENLANQTLPAVEAAADIQDTIVAYRLAQNRLIDLETTNRNLTELRNQEARMRNQIARLRSLSDDQNLQQTLSDFTVAWERFTVATNSELMRDRVSRAALDDLQAEYDQLLNTSNQLRQISRREAADARTTVTSAYDTARSVTIALLAIAVMFSAVIGYSMALDLADDLRTFTAATEQITAGNLDEPVQITSEDELGKLADAFRHMVATLSAKNAEVAAKQAELIARNDEISQAYAELQVSMQERDALTATIRALATPLIPIQAGVMITPLVGVFDSERINLFTETLLQTVERSKTHTVILDVTGMALIDQAVASQLLTTATAARMLGARTILVGIRPEIAQSLVGLGIDLTGITTYADLQSGVAYALRTK
jgi:rsbT co-antagonist protein RsbR